MIVTSSQLHIIAMQFEQVLKQRKPFEEKVTLCNMRSPLHSCVGCLEFNLFLNGLKQWFVTFSLQRLPEVIVLCIKPPDFI